MNDNLLLLEQNQEELRFNSSKKPQAAELVTALLQAEKSSKHSKQSYSFNQLIGTWRLCFITGTVKTRKKAGKILGSGRYLPNWVTILLSYSQNTDKEARGRVENLVKLGFVQLSLTGPVKFLPPKNILGFDFTQISVKIFTKTVYSGYMRRGKKSEENFYQERIAKQAFFSYFWIGEQIIAARGRGGGLALWTRIEEKTS